MVNYEQLSGFCFLANQVIQKSYGRSDCCVFATATVCKVLAHFGILSETLRVEVAIFPNASKHGGVVLGHLGDGTRRTAAVLDHWKGHLCSLVEGVYLLDTTFDQVNVGRRDLKAGPLVIDLRRTKWFDEASPYGCPWTGCLSMFDATVRYTRFPRQVGFKSAGDFRPSRRRLVLEELIGLAKPILIG